MKVARSISLSYPILVKGETAALNDGTNLSALIENLLVEYLRLNDEKTEALTALGVSDGATKEYCECGAELVHPKERNLKKCGACRAFGLDVVLKSKAGVPTFSKKKGVSPAAPLPEIPPAPKPSEAGA